MVEHFRVGYIANTHGIKGDAKVYPTTEDVNRFKKLKKVYVKTKNGLETLEITKVSMIKNMVLLHFKGIDDINDLLKYKGLDLLVDREDAIPLEEGEFYIADMIGAKVYADNYGDPSEVFGTVKDIFPTGANLVMTVDHEGKEVLIPMIDQCVLEKNVEECYFRVHIMDGLM
ncbi:MAG: ribosome maturation factor RimM [Lachnospiraceae bacterium]|nr:ribosome maturation factor RimM [Lachnospiraceae bacterium]